MKSLAIYYEHPEWFKLLFAELNRRGIPFTEVLAHELSWDPEDSNPPAEVLLSRMSPSAWKRGHANAILSTKDYLRHVEARGALTINGTNAWSVEVSKALQLDLFREAQVHYPKARVINHPSQAVKAAQGLQFPVVVKANIGGSGAGIYKFDTPEELAAGTYELGLDSLSLVQEFLPARDSKITRVEILNGELLYAIEITTDFSNFNLCPADICQIEANAPKQQPNLEVCPVEAPKRLQVARVHPPAEIVEAAKRLAALSKLDVGGIEYLINERDGQPYFYDINALSNFVSDAPNVLGFDPTAKFVDFLVQKLT